MVRAHDGSPPPQEGRTSNGSFRAPPSAPTEAFSHVREKIPENGSRPELPWKCIRLRWGWGDGGASDESEISSGQRKEGMVEWGEGGWLYWQFTEKFISDSSPCFPSEDSMIYHVQLHARVVFFFIFQYPPPHTFLIIDAFVCFEVTTTESS